MVKSKINVTVNLTQVVKRIAELSGCPATQKGVAEQLGLSEQSFSNRKARGTIVELIVQWALDNAHSIDHLLTGEGSDTPVARASPDGVELPHVGWSKLTKSEQDLLGKALDVIRSRGTEGGYAEALEGNINAFHHSVTTERPEGAKKKTKGNPANPSSPKAR